MKLKAFSFQLVAANRPRRWLSTKTANIMKLTFLFLTVGFLQVSASGVSQTVSFSGNNVSLLDIFAAVKQQTGYVVFYDNDVLKSSKPVSLSVKDEPLTSFLSSALRGQSLGFSIKKKTIVISSSPSNVPSQTNSSGTDELFSSAPIRGKVLDSLGRPLSGATVALKDKILGVTDAEGVFNVNVTEGDVLTVTFVGYQPRKIVVTKSMFSTTNNLIITLKSSIDKLENVEVVVSTGYQDIPKERATGSFAKIDNQLLNRKVSTNILDRIYEVTSGLVFFNSNQNLSPVPSLMIRGVSTINANNSPLIVVDNFPYDGNINNINPNDVESITVLKDAAAASIWGVLAGNGVIVITTKRGKINQRARVVLNNNITIGEKPNPFYVPVIASSDAIDYEVSQFGKGFYNDYDDIYPSANNFPALPIVAEILLAARRKGITDPINDLQVKTELNALSKIDIRNDLKNYLLHTSVCQQYSMNISGGGSNYNYFASIGFDDIKSNEIGNTNKRVTLSLNNTWIPSKNIEISTQAYLIQGKSKTAGISYGSLLPTSKSVSPYSQLKDMDGNSLSIPFMYRLAYIDTAKYPGLLDWHYRPLDELNENYSLNRPTDMRVSFGMNLTLLPGLIVSVRSQYQTVYETNSSYNSSNSYWVRNSVNRFMTLDPMSGKINYPFPMGSNVTQSPAKTTIWNTRVQLNLNKKWKSNEIVALAGSEVREYQSERSYITIIGYDDDLGISPSVDFSTPFVIRPEGYYTPINGGEQPRTTAVINRNGSYFSNGAYTYNSKYIITASGRIDQANIFGVKTNQRIVPLWSAGLGWNVYKEDFFRISWLSYLKIRATYGYNGNTNNRIIPFATINYTNNPTTVPTGATFASIISPPNPHLKWERVKVVNLGLDYEISNKRAFGSIEYFRKTGSDLLGPVLSDPTSGVVSYTGNTSSIRSTGVDITINTLNLNKAIKWSTIFLFSYNTDKIVSYQQLYAVSGRSFVNDNFIMAGLPRFQLSSYHWAGLDPITGEPQIFLGDTVSSFRNISKANPEDIKLTGTSNPKIYGSVRNEIGWKNISLSFNITYKFNYFFRRSSFDFSMLYFTWGGHSDYAKRWQKPGDELITNVPAVPNAPDGRDEVYKYSDILVERGDHIRFQDIRIGYSMNRTAMKIIKVNGELYFYANNIGILWMANKHNIDPEAFGFGAIPSPRTYALGFRLEL